MKNNNTTLSEQRTTIPPCQNSSKMKNNNTTLSEQFQNEEQQYHPVRTVHPVPKYNEK